MSQKPTDGNESFGKKNRLLNDEELMTLFGVSKCSLYRWRKKEYLPFIKMGGTYYYSEKIINKMIEQQSHHNCIYRYKVKK
ncbi:helix-turn-helix domain-containing protein [Aequorivita echinoideorum]|uniref:Helix-turn-helix domain-containing protein n=1 Tax=Aequorivita echinoideorum TaxID=1549647 RepID=A0ABS5S6B9_9FLAO|nr:helix-turn-helix domain-containing protein [Aequorivita echinoideorum]MBT0607980.1 helix-turn-helix domain-containing protein [Aequorivita echinoideorum]